jgi:hypothetical protein
MSAIIKRDTSTSVLTIQGIMESDYEHEISYWKA